MNTNFNLFDLGWNEGLQQQFNSLADSYTIGRVAVEYKGMYKLYCESGEILASISGKMLYSAYGREDYPAVGDWVIIDKTNASETKTIIHGILKRKSKFSRKSAGNTFDEQIVAANIDIIFLCMALNENYNLRRLERYVTIAWDSGALPVILLTKIDLSDNVEEKVSEVRLAAPGVDVLCTSSLNKFGIEDVKRFIKPGITVALIGSSGIGKSTIINEILGENIMVTQRISEANSKGRHTTTHRELLLLPEGGIVIDTPGMRELHLLESVESVDSAFGDIDTLSKECKFTNCTHNTEPGCAVQEAISSGLLSEERYNSYIKLKKESDFVRRKTDKKAELDYKKHIKKLKKANKSNHKR